MPASVKQLRDNQNNFIYPKIAKEGLVEPIYGSDVTISTIDGLNSSDVQGALNELVTNLGNIDSVLDNVEIVNTASESVISVSDSADYRLLGLKLYGKSVQDGTPSPETPVEIQSAGDSGSVTVTLSDGGTQTQTLTYATPNGLPGIPVEDGGNYTDSDGQQWICDEVDFGRGKYVQRVKIRAVTSTDRGGLSVVGTDETTTRGYINAPGKLKKNTGGLMSNAFKYGKYTYKTVPINYITDENSDNILFGVDKTLGSTIEEIRQNFVNNGVKFLYVLAEPVETDLPAEVLEAYAALATYKPATTITTDSDPAAGMEVRYLTNNGLAEVLDYYASKDDLDGKQDKLSGTAGQFVGFGADGNAEAQDITAADVGAMAAVDGGTTGQYLRKTADGQAWQDGPDLSGYATQSWVQGQGYLTAVPAEYVTDSELTGKGYATTADVAETYAKKALKFTGTFTAAGWTSATGGYSQTINVSGLTADDEPIVDLNSTATDADTFNGQLEAFGLVSNFQTGDGTLTAVVLGDSAPTVDIPIHGVVVY